MLKHLNKYSHVYVTAAIVVFFVLLTGGLLFREAGYSLRLEKEIPVAVTVAAPPAAVADAEAPEKPAPGWTVKTPSEAAEFISGPVAASVGELCVFRLNDPATYADWCIVPEATCYVDTSGSSLAFASNNSATYTIIAAIVEDGVPKILTHVCQYGTNPQPDPEPTPNPDPTPKPNPPPNPVLTLKDWVAQNVPEAGRSQCSALAFCYEATAEAIEKGSVQTQAAAYSTLRTATQTKIDTALWSEFLDALSGKISTALEVSTDVKKLGVIFREIAEGLKAVSSTETGDAPEPVASTPVILPFPTQSSVCSDPTGRACQPQPIIQYRRRAR